METQKLERREVNSAHQDIKNEEESVLLSTLTFLLTFKHVNTACFYHLTEFKQHLLQQLFMSGSDHTLKLVWPVTKRTLKIKNRKS